MFVVFVFYFFILHLNSTIIFYNILYVLIFPQY